jgi:hypothetical protein
MCLTAEAGFLQPEEKWSESRVRRLTRNFHAAL